jgi:DNA-binding SARP family transcriptional activator/tetratricopeptide (TPR) repeat protein
MEAGGSLISIDILGAVVLRKDSEPVPLARRHQRQLLGILALELNRPLSPERLIDLVWAEDLPRSPRAVLQTRLSELRAVLQRVSPAEVALVKSGSGYLLQAEPDVVDAHRFLRATRDWRQAPSLSGARDVLHRALSLWHGPLFGGALPGDPGGGLSGELDQARTSATEDLFALELALGNHERIADTARAFARENPTREKAVTQSLLSLCLSGRTAEALDDHDQYRRRLRDHLGVDPGRPITDLHLAAIDNDIERVRVVLGQHLESLRIAMPDAPQDGFQPRKPSLLPRATPDFSGRETERQQLVDILLRQAGERIVFVTGSGGVGKSALAVHTAHALAHRFSDGILYANLRGSDATEAASPFDVLGRFLVALGVDGSSLSDSLDARVDLYRSILSERDVLIVLDDALDGVQATPLLPAKPPSAAVITARSAFGSLLGIETVRLDVLDHDTARNFLASMIGQQRIEAEPDSATELCRLSGGLPLALRIAGAKIASRPHRSIATMVAALGNERRRLDHLSIGELDVRATFRTSFDDMSTDARLLLARIGDLNLRQVPAWVCAALLGTDGESTDAALDELTDAHLLDPFQNVAGPAGYDIHDLVRLFARERSETDCDSGELSAARARTYDAALALARTAYRAVYGGDYLNIVLDDTLPDIDARYVEPVAAHPIAWFEGEEQTLGELVSLAARDQCVTHVWQLVCTLSPPFQMVRRFDHWQRLLRLAERTVDEAGDLLGTAAIKYRIGWLLADYTRYQDSLDVFVDAGRMLRQHGDMKGYGAVLVNIGMDKRWLGDTEGAFAAYREATSILSECGDEHGYAHALRGIGQLHMNAGRFEESERNLQAALDIYQRIDSPQGRAMVSFWLGMLDLRRGNAERAESRFSAALDLCERLGDRPGVGNCLRGLGLAYRAAGKYAEARRTLNTALDMVRQPRKTLLESTILEAIAGLPES